MDTRTTDSSNSNDADLYAGPELIRRRVWTVNSAVKTSCWKHVSLGASNHHEGDVKTLTGSLAGGVDGPEDQDVLNRLATDIVPTMSLIGV